MRKRAYHLNSHNGGVWNVGVTHKVGIRRSEVELQVGSVEALQSIESRVRRRGIIVDRDDGQFALVQFGRSRQGSSHVLLRQNLGRIFRELVDIQDGKHLVRKGYV